MARVVLEVREDSEYEAEHIPGSLHIPLRRPSPSASTKLPRDRPIAAICRGGKRSGLAASILQREGFADVIHVGKGRRRLARRGQPGRVRLPPASPTEVIAIHCR